MHKNIFIAIGGSGTKVAEALARLLILGFPMSFSGGADESIEIWRLDPDKTSGAAGQLKDVLTLYENQILAPTINERFSLRKWCPRLPTPAEAEAKFIYPLDFPSTAADTTGTLNGLLNDQEKIYPKSQLLLDLLFRPADLCLPLTSGFYQKPFIGSTLMAVYQQERMGDGDSSIANTVLSLQTLTDKDVRFFLCGSLHGGTGAACVPIMAKFLKAKGQANWRVAACLMAPYSYPPPPEDIELGDYAKREFATAKELDDAVEVCYQKNKSKNIASFQSLTELGQKGLIRQMLTGALAKSDELEKRAKNALKYYEQGRVPCDLLFYVGAPEPKEIKTPWSNGGATQRNPPMYTETVAALCAMQFFSANTLPSSSSKEEARKIIPASTKGMRDRCTKSLGWKDLPRYRTFDGKDVYPERAILASAAIAWALSSKNFYGEELDREAKNWDRKPTNHLRDYLIQQGREGQMVAVEQLKKALEVFEKLLFNPNSEGPMGLLGSNGDESEERGWDRNVQSQLRSFFKPVESKNDPIFIALNNKKPLPAECKATLSVEMLTQVNLTGRELDAWNGNVSTGGFLRALWNAIYQKLGA